MSSVASSGVQTPVEYANYGDIENQGTGYSNAGLPPDDSCCRDKTGSLFFNVMEWVSEIYFSILGRGIECACDWVEYLECSPAIQEMAQKVKTTLGPFHAFAAGCDVVTAAREGDFIGFVGASTELAGRLEEQKVITLAKDLSPAFQIIGAGADGLSGIIGTLNIFRDWDSRTPLGNVIRVAKNVSLVALATLAGIAAGCAIFAVAAPVALSFYILAAGTTLLACKTLECFWSRLNKVPSHQAEKDALKRQLDDAENRLKSQGQQFQAEIAAVRREAFSKGLNTRAEISFAEREHSSFPRQGGDDLVDVEKGDSSSNGDPAFDGWTQPQTDLGIESKK